MVQEGAGLEAGTAALQSGSLYHSAISPPLLTSTQVSPCLVVGGPVNVEQLDDVGMGAKLLEEDDLAKSSLCVCSVAKGVENLLHGDDGAGFSERNDRRFCPLTDVYEVNWFLNIYTDNFVNY
jgi:hypothetical protein